MLSADSFGMSWPRRWRSWLAWLGIGYSFLFCGLPGLLALRSYRRWRRGETPEPLLPLFLGWFVAIGLVCYVVIVLTAVLAT